MAKVTSKLQVTVPKALAERYAIRPGDEIAWEAAGDAIRVVPHGRARRPTGRRGSGSSTRPPTGSAGATRSSGAARPPAGRGWTREELYDRGRAR